MSMTAELVGVDEALRLLKEMPERTRRAASGAINDTLKEVQTFTGSKLLPEAFTLRGRGRQWWQPGQKFGFNIRPYSNPESLTGILGSQADWLRLQEFGGTKTVPGHNLAIPASDYKAPSDIMARRIKPRTILDRRSSGAFKATMRNGKMGIFKRVGDARLPIKLLFSLEPDAKVPKRLSFEEDGQKMADSIYGLKFAIQFAKQMGL
jgi:hypothetical protein